MAKAKNVKVEIPVGMEKPKETSPKIKIVEKIVKYNEKGERLKKDGTPWKKPVGRTPGAKVVEALKQAKLLKQSQAEVIESDSDSDSDYYDIEDLSVLKKKGEVLEVEVPVEKIVEVEKVVEVPVVVEKMIDDVESKEAVKRLKKEKEDIQGDMNRLKDTFNYNSHLNRISQMSKHVAIKF